MDKRVKSWALGIVVLGAFSIGGYYTANAETAESPNYQISETEFGSNAPGETCAGGICASPSIGSMDAQASSGSMSASFGPIPENSDPLLEVIVEPGVSNLGILSTDKTATKTTVLKIRNYLSDGYMVYINGKPPKYKDHYLASPTVPTDSAKGSEQFAINLVANTIPTVGSSLKQMPGSDFSFGEVVGNYGTENKFMYKDGDMIARSLQSSGQTEYTISMIVNVSSSTPAGHFAGDYSLTVVPQF